MSLRRLFEPKEEKEIGGRKEILRKEELYIL
jgi:hypothetical protein